MCPFLFGITKIIVWIFHSVFLTNFWRRSYKIMIYYKIVDAWKESIFAKHYYFSYQFIKQYLNCITVKNVKVKTTYKKKISSFYSVSNPPVLQQIAAYYINRIVLRCFERHVKVRAVDFRLKEIYLKKCCIHYTWINQHIVRTKIICFFS